MALKRFGYVILWCLVPALLLAQEVTGSISGRVKDLTGAAVPGADITATHIATQTVRTALSGPEGSFAFPALQIGDYEISATMPGFKKTVQSGIELHIADKLTVD